MTITSRNLSDFKYENLSKNYLVKQKNFEYQYAPLYAERLITIKKSLKETILNKWSNKYEIKSLVDLNKNEKCVIIGTLFKEMKFKPNILKELAEDESNSLPFQPVLNRDAKYIDEESDQLILEDELQRIVLVDSEGCDIIKQNKLCTGLVIALLGHENESSAFEVEDYCFKQTPVHKLSIPISINTSKDDKYVIFLSGLELGDSDQSTNDCLYKFQLFIDFLRGDFIQNENLTNILSNSIRLVICGNSLSSSTQSKDMINKAKYLIKNYVAGSVTAIKQLDDYLSQLISKIEVDIMPGEFDPSNLMLPQQPLHHSMLTKSVNSNFKYNLHTTTNPYKFMLNQICFLGTSGQFIDDIRKSTSENDTIKLMQLTLEAGHLGPTCPDTLACYPYYGKDPFILDELPNVYFVGNQAEFKHETLTLDYDKSNKIHLLSLPKFSHSNSCVFFNLNTFKSEEIFF